MTALVHTYARKLLVEQEAYCDYLPGGKIYLEYWGLENDAKYAERKRIKQQIYAQNAYNLIELTDDDMFSLDDVMPRQLLKFGIRAD